MRAIPLREESPGSITDAQLTEIAEIKMPDLNAYDIDAAKLQVAGTARQMGVARSRADSKNASAPDYLAGTARVVSPKGSELGKCSNPWGLQQPERLQQRQGAMTGDDDGEW